MTPSLPPPREGQTTVKVSPMIAGSLTLPDRFFVHPADPEAKRTVPSLAFLIQHPGTFGTSAPKPFFPIQQGKPFNLVFDLGLRRAADRYIPVQKAHLETRGPYTVAPGVAAQLEQQGVSAGDIDAVIISHVHYDHHGKDFCPSLESTGRC
jgi:glyoxylase-like metal-dependent hydrolase (beta-lactamase superfamily II)